jgi:hypothetical protein
MIIKRVIPTTGVARTWIHPVAYSDHEKRGMRNQLIPGALIRWIVVTKFSPVSIEENPRIKAANVASGMFVPERRL